MSVCVRESVCMSESVCVSEGSTGVRALGGRVPRLAAKPDPEQLLCSI